MTGDVDSIYFFFSGHNARLLMKNCALIHSLMSIIFRIAL